MKLQSKILQLLIPVIVVPMSILGWSGFHQLHDSTREITFSQINALLIQTKFSFDAHLKNVESNLELFASSSVLKRYLLTDNQEERYFLQQPIILKLFADYQHAYPEYYDIQILSPAGIEGTRSTRPLNLEQKSLTEHLFWQLSSNRHRTFSQNLLHEQQFSLIASKPIWLQAPDRDPSEAPAIFKAYIVVFSSLLDLR